MDNQDKDRAGIVLLVISLVKLVPKIALPVLLDLTLALPQLDAHVALLEHFPVRKQALNVHLAQDSHILLALLPPNVSNVMLVQPPLMMERRAIRAMQDTIYQLQQTNVNHVHQVPL